MKILLVNDYITLPGGAEFMILTLRDGLRRRGHDARIFSSSVGGDPSAADYKCFGTTSRFRTLLQTANPWAFQGLRRALSQFRPDVVHVQMFLTQLSPLILPLLKDVPSLYRVVWYRPLCPLGTKMLPDGSPCHVPAGPACYHNRCLPLHDWFPLMFQMQLWKRWRHVFKLIVADSKALKHRLISEGIRPVEVIWNGIPVGPERPPLSSPPTVAFAGRLVREKGAEVLLRAFVKVVAEIPDARLLLVGDGPERKRLNQMTLENGIASSVEITGNLSRPEMEKRFEKAWVQAVPSLWAEPFGLVAIDAMMRGTAVVTSAIGGLTETVQEGRTGLLVKAGDADGLTNALIQLLRNRELAEEMGKAGREVALKNFTETIYVEKFIQTYQRIAERR